MIGNEGAEMCCVYLFICYMCRTNGTQMQNCNESKNETNTKIQQVHSKQKNTRLPFTIKTLLPRKWLH